jgi:hypothetical protein
LRPSIGGKISDKDIPDAIITLNQRTKWTSLVEVKLGANDLDQTQLARYLNRAIAVKANALITISNELCLSPKTPPLRLKPAEKRLRNFPHFHWSWRYIQSEITKILKTDLDDYDAKILEQLSAFLEDDKSDIKSYHEMPSCWPAFVDRLKVSATPSQNDVDDIIAGWFQESADLAFILDEETTLNVSQVVKSKTPEIRKEKAEKLLNKNGDLSARFETSQGKYIDVLVDVNGRCVRFETGHEPTSSVKTPFKQVERFLDKFRDNEAGDWGDHSDVHLFARWPYAKEYTDESMSELFSFADDGILKDSPLIRQDKDKLMELIVRYTPSVSASVFKSRKKFVSFLEDEALFFFQTYVEI